MNTQNINSLPELDALIQLTIRQRILEALHRPGITLDMLTKMTKLYQKTIDQELKANALKVKQQELALKKQKLAAEQAKEEARKVESDKTKNGSDGEKVKETRTVSPLKPDRQQLPSEISKNIVPVTPGSEEKVLLGK